jgi:hypothetical protein
MRAGRGRLGIAVAAVVVQLAALVLAHDLVYLARYGSRYGEALVHSGHGVGWQAAVVSSLLLGGIAATVAAARLIWLHRTLRRAPTLGVERRADARTLLGIWLRIGPALAVSTAVLLTLQENIEQAGPLGALGGLGILLTPEYAGGLWIALAVGFVIAAVVALVGWRLRVLEARLRTARARGRIRTVANAPRRTIVVHEPMASLLGRRSALRAPPVALPAS